MATPFESITDTNKSMLVQLLTLMFLIIAILGLIVRLATKLSKAGRLAVEDYLAIGATIVAIGQSVAVIIQSQHGLGRRFVDLDDRTFAIEAKSEYAANALFIVTICLAKLSYMASVATLAQDVYKKYFVVGGIVTIAWALGAFLVSLFACPLPLPWMRHDIECIKFPAFWMYFSVSNIVLELIVIAAMATATIQIRTLLKRRILVMTVFGNRILIIPAIICQIYFSNKGFAGSDITFDMWQASIVIQIVQMLAIITVCIPYLKPFLDSLESGQMRADGTQMGTGDYASNKYRGHTGGSNTIGHKYPTPFSNNSTHNGVQVNHSTWTHHEARKPSDERSEASILAKSEVVDKSKRNGRYINPARSIQQTISWHVSVSKAKNNT